MKYSPTPMKTVYFVTEFCEGDIYTEVFPNTAAGLLCAKHKLAQMVIAHLEESAEDECMATAEAAAQAMFFNREGYYAKIYQGKIPV